LIMEVKNGIIIDGVLHKLVNTNSEAYCDDCSLYGICHQSMLICHMLGGDIFVSCGKVTVTLSREEPKNVGEIYRNGVKIDKEE
jgi:hypothetical protein